MKVYKKNKCRYYIENKSINKNNIKLKKIALEETIIWPNQHKDVDENFPLEFVINTGNANPKINRLLDITGIRLKEMKENNVIIQVISPTAAGIQYLKLSSSKLQIEKAKEVNNYMFDSIKDYPNNFKAFCTLPMRNPKKAAIELERCIKELGMVGALVNGNDIKTIKKNNKEIKIPLFFDTKDYDVLWKKFEELDVPIYFHPTVFDSIGNSIPDENLQSFYKNYPSLTVSAWGFSIYLAQQMMRLIVSGVFDRFPKLKVILGHMGELLPWWAERYDHRICMYKQEMKLINKATLKKWNLPNFNVQKLSLSEYLRKNFYITTSGFFSNDALEYAIKKVGIDRVMFSIDYPYEKQDLASEWMDNVPLSMEDKEKIAYKNAAKLLKLTI